MRVLIVEDERPTAEDIEFLVKQILGARLKSIHIENTLNNALIYLEEKTIDLLFLDLNLNEKDGFEILKKMVSKSFYTIVISANINRAIEAFEYGVLDFIPKPYSMERISAALARLEKNHSADGHSLKYLSVKKGNEVQVIALDEIGYFKSANIYTELILKNGSKLICDKTIKQLMTLLPENYIRIHKSFIVSLENIDTIQIFGGGKNRVVLKSRDLLPVSRQQIKILKTLLVK